MKPQIITIGEQNFSYFDTGGTGLPVVFLHGFPFDKQMWHDQLASLGGQFRMLALDIRGFGQSQNFTSEVSIGQFADDVIDFMDALHLKKSIVCGLSMGGYIALNIATRFPLKLSGLILSNTQCRADTAEAREKRVKAIAHIEKHGLEEFTETFIKNIFSPEKVQRKDPAVELTKTVMLSTPTETVTKTLKALAEREATCGKLAQITFPSLVIAGSEDTITPPALAEEMASGIPNASLVIIDQAGHLANLDHPEVYNQILRTFLEKLA